MDKRDKNFYFTGGMELKLKVNKLAEACAFLYGVMNDPERTEGAKKDARSEYNFLYNHMNTIIKHYEKIEQRLHNEGETELLQGFQDGFRFDQED